MLIVTTLIIVSSAFANSLLANEQSILSDFFLNINRDVVKYNSKAAEIAWAATLDPNESGLSTKSAKYQRERLEWERGACDTLATLRERHLLNDTQMRQTYLLCRGPVYNFKEARQTSDLYNELQSIYADSRICIPTLKYISTTNLTQVEEAILKYLTSVKVLLTLEDKRDLDDAITFAVKISLEGKETENNTLCLRGEPHLEKLMSFSRNEAVLKWIWLVWREKVGPPMREPYLKLVNLGNRAARRNGYSDIGASWRDELEIANLRQFCRQLYEDVRPLYTMLHGVMRFYLRRHYGNIVPERGLIPAHLLGNMWSQNWESLVDLIYPNDLNLDESIRKANWTVLHMIKRVEDFYQSLGFPAMSERFWQTSVFAAKADDVTRCHGAAADMFQNGDYRLIYCANTSLEDFYVLHHEMGHIQYYMSYEQQPGLFRQGANSAFQESIGDAIMYGVLTPQHLHRLGLINDSYLYMNDDDDNHTDDPVYDVEGLSKIDADLEAIKGVGDEDMDKDYDLGNRISKDELFLLKVGLNRIPQIPFALLVDLYRWDLFAGDIDEGSINKGFWDLVEEFQGVTGPDGERGEDYFDAGAKYHVPDNTPYIRYYLSSFLQLQLFETLCKTAVFGKREVDKELPETIPLNKCDIYGSKAAGKVLRDLMSKGSSQHWRESLYSSIGIDNISASSLNEYYQPLSKLLTRLITAYRIPLGW